MLALSSFIYTFVNFLLHKRYDIYDETAKIINSDDIKRKYIKFNTFGTINLLFGGKRFLKANAKFCHPKIYKFFG